MDNDYWDDKLDATAVVCRNCYDTTYFEFDYCHHCGFDLSQEPEGEDDAV